MNDNELHRIIDLAFFVKEHGFNGGVEKMGIDADTTSEELDNVERWFFGLNRFQLETLFATLEAFPVVSVNELEARVDEVLTGSWRVYDQIRTTAELGFWLTHDGEYAGEGDNLGDPDAILQATELLADGVRWQRGALVPGRGYVSFSER